MARSGSKARGSCGSTLLLPPPFWGGGAGRRRDAVDDCESPHDPHPQPLPTRGRGATIMTALTAILIRDMRIAVRVGGGALIGVLFFLVVVTLTPFAIGPDLALLKRIGPAILWIAALLATLLALDRLFAADHEDGSLDLLLMSQAPLELV